DKKLITFCLAVITLDSRWKNLNRFTTVNSDRTIVNFFNYSNSRLEGIKTRSIGTTIPLYACKGSLAIASFARGL
ncbi:MAG: hypothetical protein AAF383_29940, partial [Cyanobacteria bacterium P01_A01_bin.83]